MSDIFREVDEDLRREQYKAIWEKYGAYILALAAIIVIATAGWRGYQYYQGQKAAQSGDQFVAAMALMESGKNADAAAAFAKLAADSVGRYPTIATLAAAGSKAAAGDKAGAVADFDRVANDGGAPQTLRDMARLRSAYLQVDTADRADLQRRVGDLAATTNPLQSSAREILGLAAWKAGDLDGAKTQFTAIYVDMTTSPNARRRAQLMLQLIDAHSSPAADAAPGTPAPPSGATQ